MYMLENEHSVIDLISNDVSMMSILRIVKSLNLPDWCVCAGFVRSKVWDYLHGFHTPTPLPDIDVVYFDPENVNEVIEKDYEEALKQLDGLLPWSVKNQARMHQKNGNAAYLSMADGLAHFPEVCTAIGVYLDASDAVRLVAPYGIDDLLHLVVHPTPFYATEDKKALYEHRVQAKNWFARWPRLTIHHP